MGEQAKRHHLVSKFYLRYFADERDQITTVMLPGDRRFTQSINNCLGQQRLLLRHDPFASERGRHTA
jgi:hypothetical protein